MDDQRHVHGTARTGDRDADSPRGAHAEGTVAHGDGEGSVTERVRNAEVALETLRETTAVLEREVAVIRADLERLRREAERAAGSRLP